MKLFLFLDDWFLDSRIDVVRVFPAANHEETWQNTTLGAPWWRASKRRYEAWAGTAKRPRLMQSTDGKHWTRAKPPRKVSLIGDPPRGCQWTLSTIPEAGKHLLDFHDPWDGDSRRQYKTLVRPFVRKVLRQGGTEGGPSFVACSPDGENWTVDSRHAWFTRRHGSDTTNNIFYNPFTRHWQAICRCYNLDRRIAMVESPDLENWTEPRCIIHPDVADEPCMQFYGMPAFLYEDEYFIGVVQRYLAPLEEYPGDLTGWMPNCMWSKWSGSVDGQLAYSYDGRSWLRTDRRSVVVPRSEPGAFGAGAIYALSLSTSPEDRILIHSIGTTIGHGLRGKGYPSHDRGLIRHSLRKDGFCYLEPRGWGQITTRTLVPDAPRLTVNFQGPQGEVLVQITDFKRKPMKGYTFADCVPLSGDKTDAPVRWRKHNDLSGLLGKRIRLEFRMRDARLYAFRLACKLWYTNTPKPIERI